MTPNRIHVEKRPSLEFKNAKAADALATELGTLRYEDAGFYAIIELPEVCLRCFYHIKDAALAVVFEKPGVGVWVEFACRYEESDPIRSFTATNVDSHRVGVLDKPPGVVVRKFPKATVAQLHKKFTSGRPTGKFLEVTADCFGWRIEDGWAHEMDWRNQRGGPTAQEIARVSAASADWEDRNSAKKTDPLQELLDRLHAVRLEQAHIRQPPKSLTGAVIKGDRKLVEEFLAAGFGVNERTVGFSSPLNPAAKRGDFALVDLLLSHGCKASWPDEFISPMTNAAESGNVAILQRLINAGVDINKEGSRALAIVARNGNGEAVRFLLKSGVRPDSNALAGAAQGGDVEMINLLFSAGAEAADAGKALQWAAYSGHFPAAKLLVETGVNPNTHPHYNTGVYGEESRKPVLPAALARVRGFRQLSLYLNGGQVDQAAIIAEAPKPAPDALAELAAALGELEELTEGKRFKGAYREGAILRILEIIKSGKIGKRVNQRDRKGRHALTLAASNGDIEVIKALLAAGAQAQPARDGFWTPLHAAARQGHGEAVKLLLAAGANPNAPAQGGGTPLMQAVEWGDPEIVRVLLDAGADPKAKNSNGQKAMAIDAGLHDKTIKAMLKGTGEGPQGKTSRAGRGILCKRKRKMVDVSIARGTKHFTEYFGNREWAIAIVRAPAESVARQYADVVKSPRWDQDVSNKRVLTATRFVYVLQFKHAPWSLVLRSLGWVGMEELKGMPIEARELSSRLKTGVYAFLAEDTSGCEGYELFENGKSLEKVEWDGELRFKSTLRRSKPKFETAFPDPVFADEGIYLPACWFEDDGEVVKLGLEGIAADAVDRVDFIVLKV